MSWTFWAISGGLLLLLPTAYAGFVGAPYAPTRRRAIRHVFAALHVGANDVVYDLGAGDGSVLLAAAARGARAVGIELSPPLWLVARLRTFGTRGVQLRYGNFYRASVADATVIFVFLMPKTVPHLLPYLRRQRLPRGKYLLSYLFPLPETITPLQVVRTPAAGPVYVYDLQELTRAA